MSLTGNRWVELAGPAVIACSLVAYADAAWGLRDGWAQTHKLTATDAAADDEYGRAVAIHGPWAIVGAMYDDWGGYFGCGAAYLIIARLSPRLKRLNTA